MEKMKMQSENLVDENVEIIGKKFPNCIVEGKNDNGEVVKIVDFDLLKQELSKVLVEGNQERYVMNWPDKRQAILTANAPISKTLRPVVADEVKPTGCDSNGQAYLSSGSVGKDGTPNKFDSENIYIEGDNLDVLKLLRETYLNKIKMIYIDPPYNTGNDFVYEDDFAIDTEEYLQRSNQVDEQGNRLAVNNESNGRFHTDWLNMIYPRLKLARDLLTDDGAIFISIDDNEQANLKRICDEIFGESNFICNFIRQTRKGGGSMSRFVSSDHDYVIMYAKNINSLNKLYLPYDNDYIKRYKEEDDKGKFFWDTFARNRQGSSNYYTITAPDGTILKNAWIYKEDKFKELLNSGEVRFKETNNGWSVQCKQRISADGQVMRTLLKDFTNEIGTKTITDLIGKDIFSYCKPVELIMHLMKGMLKNEDIIIDFFSGSATTAHAVMQLNAEDGGNRKFIMVQLPETTDEKSEAYKAGYKNICEIGKERIRRAGKKIKEEIEKSTLLFGKDKRKDVAIEDKRNAVEMVIDKIDEKNYEYEKLVDKKILDIGFRVLKLDSSNMKDVYYSPSETTQSNLLDLISNIKEDRSAEDLLFQVMLDMGIELSKEIEKKTINNKTVYIVGKYDEESVPNLVCCFDENISEEVVTEIAKLKPLYAVFRDSSFASDSISVNFDQIFETYSPTTTRKVL